MKFRHHPHILVEFDRKLDHNWFSNSQTLSRFEDAISERLHQIYFDLGIHNDSFSIELKANADLADGVFFNVMIDDTCCRGPQNRLYSDLTPEHLSDRVTEHIFENRDLFVSHDFTEAARRYYFRRWNLSDSAMSFDSFRNILIMLIQHGHHFEEPLTKLKTLLRQDIKAEQIAQQVETIFSTVARREIIVTVSSKSSLIQSVLNDTSEETREQLFQELGIIIPPISIKHNEELNKDDFCISINDLRGPVRKLYMTDISSHIQQILQVNAWLFLTVSSVDRLLGRLRQAFPMAAFNAVEVFGTFTITQVLRKLLEESVSIRDLRTILGAMLEVDGILSADLNTFEVLLPNEANFVVRKADDKAPISTSEYTDYVRIQLKNQICQMHASERNELHTYRISKGIEQKLSQIAIIPLTEQEQNRLVSSILQQVGTRYHNSVILTSFHGRRLFREMICRDFPDLPVLCEQEISEYVNIRPVGEIDCDFQL